MKTIFCIIWSLLVLVLLGPPAMANKTVLNAGEVNEFFSDRTMTIKEEIPDKKTGKTLELKAFLFKTRRCPGNL
jgi:hypothetical protein